MDVNALDSETLEANMKRLLSTERGALVVFLRHLAEFDKRTLYRKYNYATLWQYCQRELRMSEFQTYHRTTGAALLDRFPIAADYLADGRVCLTTLVLLRDALTEQNVVQALDAAVGKRRDEILLLAATLNPKNLEERTMIRSLPERPPLAVVPLPTRDAAPAAEAPPEPVPAMVVQPPPRRSFDIRPASPKQTSVSLVVGPEFVALLERARSALSHTIPSRDVVEVIAHCLGVVVHQAAKREDASALARRPRPSPQDEDSDYVTADLERQVRRRDGNRCGCLTPNGVCGSTYQLELHHIIARAKGGKTTLENLRLVCRDHNMLYARLDFGDDFMDAKIHSRRTGS